MSLHHFFFGAVHNSYVLIQKEIIKMSTDEAAGRETSGNALCLSPLCPIQAFLSLHSAYVFCWLLSRSTIKLI